MLFRSIWVVTARCVNQHTTEKGHPFYSIAQFDVSKLPVLGEVKPEQQPELFEPQAMTLLEFVEAKRNAYNKFPPLKGKS